MTPEARADMGELIGRYDARLADFEALSVRLGLPPCAPSFVSIVAVLDAAIGRVCCRAAVAQEREQRSPTPHDPGSEGRGLSDVNAIYVVQRGEYDDVRVDSVWSTLKLAEARKLACKREHGLWRTARAKFPVKWSPDLLDDPDAECIADAACVLTFEIDKSDEQHLDHPTTEMLAVIDEDITALGQQVRASEAARQAEVDQRHAGPDSAGMARNL